MAKLSTKLKSQSPGWIEYYNIRIMPHGGIILIPITLTTLAWLVSISTNGCDYSRLTGSGVEILTGSPIVPYIDLGMDAYRIPEFYPMSNSWMVSIESNCAAYQYPFQEDSAWIAGKRFGFLALWSGGASCLFLWVGTFLLLTPRQWKAVGIFVLFAALFQLLSFSWFSNSLCHTRSTTIEDFQAEETGGTTTETDVGSSSCSLLYGSRCSIASFFLYLASSLIILFGEYPMPEPKLIAEENYQMLRMAQA